MATKRWLKVAIDVQSALGTAQNILGITKANPGVLNYDGTDPSNGVYFALTVAGMRELHNRIGRVANVTAGSDIFELDEVNTTNFTTFVATGSSMQPITFGSSLGTILEVTASGGDPEFDDESTIHDDIRIQAPTLHSPFTMTFTSKWDPADTGLRALQEASDTKTTRAIRITFADGSKMAFIGYVSCTMIPTGAFPNKVTTSIVFTSLGRTSVWSD